MAHSISFANCTTGDGSIDVLASIQLFVEPDEYCSKQCCHHDSENYRAAVYGKCEDEARRARVHVGCIDRRGIGDRIDGSKRCRALGWWSWDSIADPGKNNDERSIQSW